MHQSPAISKNPSRRGFTLIELLSVIAIIGLLSVLVVPLFNSGNNEINQGLQVTAGMMDQARQYAIAKNTYTWVIIGNPTGDKDMQVGIVASKDGTDLLDWKNTPVNLSDTSPTNLYELVGKVRSLPKVKVSDQATATVNISSLPAIPGGGNPKALGEVTFKLGSGSGLKEFTKAVQFTPTGEARVANNLDRAIDVVVRAKNGPNDTPNQAVIRVTGLTGKSTVYRR